MATLFLNTSNRRLFADKECKQPLTFQSLIPTSGATIALDLYALDNNGPTTLSSPTASIASALMPETGVFELSYAGTSLGQISINASVNELASYFNSNSTIASLGGVEVSGDGPWVVRMKVKGATGAIAVVRSDLDPFGRMVVTETQAGSPTQCAVWSLRGEYGTIALANSFTQTTPASVAVSEKLAGGVADYEVQRITFTGEIYSGHYVIGTASGSTAPIKIGSSAATVESAINAVLGAGAVKVSVCSKTEMEVAWQAVGSKSALTVTATGLVGIQKSTQTLTLATTEAATLPVDMATFQITSGSEVIYQESVDISIINSDGAVTTVAFTQYATDAELAAEVVTLNAAIATKVTGPASATDNAIARFDGTTGKLIQTSAATIADTTGDITAGKYNGLTITAGNTTATLEMHDTGGSIDTSDGGGSIDTSRDGGSIDTSDAGGSIDTSTGGSIDTSDGGGSIDTRGTGSIELGVAGTRTTLVGSATAARTATIPDKSGTVAMTSDITRGDLLVYSGLAAATNARYAAFPGAAYDEYTGRFHLAYRVGTDHFATRDGRFLYQYTDDFITWSEAEVLHSVADTDARDIQLKYNSASGRIEATYFVATLSAGTTTVTGHKSYFREFNGTTWLSPTELPLDAQLSAATTSPVVDVGTTRLIAGYRFPLATEVTPSETEIGVWRSLNGGAWAWVQVFKSAIAYRLNECGLTVTNDGTVVLIARSDTNVVYELATFHSRDAGATWQWATLTPVKQSVDTLVVGGGRPDVYNVGDAIYVPRRAVAGWIWMCSTDKGLTWAQTGRRTKTDYEYGQPVVIAGDPHFIYAREIVGAFTYCEISLTRLNDIGPASVLLSVPAVNGSLCAIAPDLTGTVVASFSDDADTPKTVTPANITSGGSHLVGGSLRPLVFASNGTLTVGAAADWNFLTDNTVDWTLCALLNLTTELGFFSLINTNAGSTSNNGLWLAFEDRSIPGTVARKSVRAISKRGGTAASSSLPGAATATNTQIPLWTTNKPFFFAARMTRNGALGEVYAYINSRKFYLTTLEAVSGSPTAFQANLLGSGAGVIGRYLIVPRAMSDAEILGLNKQWLP